jgi:hypothetical protein
LWNISTQVTVVALVSLIPTISILSQTLIIHCSILPVTTVPLPLIENTSSTGIRNGLSKSLSGTGTYDSIASNKSRIGLAAPAKSVGLFNAARPDHLIIGVSSHGKSYFDNKSLISISTNSSISSSSTISHLFIKTTIYGTHTCLDNRICSLV